ncbi:hypothetical protein B566_EDAN015204 [Ephemera danica]|nr:hypothetical protein B566_EDAN015204 [Ephemera danica]
MICLQSRLFSTETVVHKSHLLLKKESQTKFNRVVIKKFLLLSSKELLVTFSRLLLAGEGDITRHLGYMGYKVVHKQGFLDEFRYSVEHLGVDLRDGVRLVRVVELLTGKCTLSSKLRLLTGKCTLSSKLRVPPVSRLQKIHNVELALQGLQKEGYEYPRFERAAKIIQQWWLHPSLRTVLARRFLARRRTSAAIVLQKHFRGHLCRRNLEVLKAELQAMKNVHCKVKIIQRCFRRYLLRKNLSRFVATKRQNDAATVIQRNVKAFLRRKRRKEEAVTKIQSYFRAAMTRKNYRLKRSSAIIIQKFVRVVLAKKELNRRREERAAVRIQTHLITALQVVLVASRDGKGFNEMTFNNVSTVLWMLARDPVKKEELKNFPGFVFKLQSTVKFVKGKDRHGQGAAVKGGKKPCVPTLRYNKEPRCFATRLHGLHCLMKRLDIKCV